MDFIIDGTNICIDNTHKKPASILPLFQVLYPLLTEGYKCKCFFDNGTYFGNELDTAIFNFISSIPEIKAPLVAPDMFEIVIGRDGNGKKKPADHRILELARRHKGAYIISDDNFSDDEFKQKYGWSEKLTGERVLKIIPHQDRIQLMRQEPGGVDPVEEFNLSKPVEDLKELAVMILNLIEGQADRLIGKIKDVRIRKNHGSGKILRRYEAEQLGLISFLSSSENHDPHFNYAKSRGEEVRFQLCINERQESNGQVKYFLNADYITLLDTIEVENKLLWEENKQLKERIQELEEQLENLNSSHSVIAGQLHEEESENDKLFLQISTLENEILVLKNLLNDKNKQEVLDEEIVLESDYLNLQQDYDELFEDFKKQRGLLQILKKSGNTPEGESRIDVLIEEIEKLKEENKRIREKLQGASAFKIVPNAVEVPNTIDPQPLLNWWNSLSDDWRSAFAHRFNMAPSNPNLVVLEKIQTAQLLELRGRHSMIPLTLPFKLKDINGLKSLKELQILNLSYNSISDFSEIHILKNLHELILVGNRPIHSLKGIEQLPHLSLLNIEATDVSEEEIKWLRTHSKSLNLDIRY